MAHRSGPEIGLRSRRRAAVGMGPLRSVTPRCWNATSPEVITRMRKPSGCLPVPLPRNSAFGRQHRVWKSPVQRDSFHENFAAPVGTEPSAARSTPANHPRRGSNRNSIRCRHARYVV
jgi:hypothetical protein